VAEDDGLEDRVVAAHQVNQHAPDVLAEDAAASFSRMYHDAVVLW
jgi:hypothetical protein